LATTEMAPTKGTATAYCVGESSKK